MLVHDLSTRFSDAYHPRKYSQFREERVGKAAFAEDVDQCKDEEPASPSSHPWPDRLVIPTPFAHTTKPDSTTDLRLPTPRFGSFADSNLV